MRKNWLYLILLFILPGFNPPDNTLTSWVVMPGSSLAVNGSTNINTFQCEITNYSLPDTLACSRTAARGQLLPMNGRLKLDIQSFDCHNKMMTNDLRKTLKAKTYPHLSIRFISINSFPDFKNPTRITGVVDIDLAGVTKRFEINYLFTIGSGQMVHLKGDRVINFSDFNLSPPSKLGGIIKAKDELSVEFKLNLKPLG